MKLENLTPKQRLKAEKWLAIIRECINSDLSNEVWCEQNNVSIKSYYYYLAKLRKMAIEQIPYKKRNNVLPLVPESNDIVEIQAPQSTPVCHRSCVLPDKPVPIDVLCLPIQQRWLRKYLSHKSPPCL